MAFLEITVISASVAPDVQLDLEPKDTYATIRCAKEQRSTKRTHDHGRLPVWNETFEFNLGDQDMPKFIFVQVFAVQSDSEGLLGVARIPIFTTGKAETSLHVLVSPDKGETGTLKAAWRWKSIPQTDNLSSYYITKDERDHNPVLYPSPASPYTDITSAMAQLAVHKGEKEPYYPTARGAVSSGAYPSNHELEERSSFTSEPYSSPGDLSKTSYPSAYIPYPPTSDGPPYPYYQNSSSPSDASPYSYYQKASSASDTPPYPDYQKTSPLSESYFPSEKEGGKLPGSTSRGLGDTTDEGHTSHVPYGYAPPGMYGGSSPPPHPPGYPPCSDQKLSSSSDSYFPSGKEREGSPSRTSRGLGDSTDRGHHSHTPYGYTPPGMHGGGYPPPPPGMHGGGYPPPPPGYPSPYGPPPGGYPPPVPAYPQASAYTSPAPHGVPPAPYGYPPSGSHYPSQPYPPHGYPGPAPYPVHPGHGSYAPGMYAGHYSHGKHSKSFKHHKMPKHGMFQYGHPQPHYGHYKHKKHKGFGKGYKLKKFKGFKKFKF